MRIHFEGDEKGGHGDMNDHDGRIQGTTYYYMYTASRSPACSFMLLRLAYDCCVFLALMYDNDNDDSRREHAFIHILGYIQTTT